MIQRATNAMDERGIGWKTAANQPIADRITAEAIVKQWGDDSFAYFALREDKKWFFSPSKSSFLAYTVVGRLAYVSGDPVGDPAEFPALINGFRDEAHKNKQHLIFMATQEKHREMYATLGINSLYIGDEEIVEPQNFSLQGSQKKRMRQAINQLRRAGYTFTIGKASAVDTKTRDELRGVSLDWRRGQPERGFSMTMDTLFALPDTSIAMVRDPDGNVIAFAQVLPLPSWPGYTVGTKRRKLEGPNGINEFLIAELSEWARQQGAVGLTISFTDLGRWHRRKTGVAYNALTQLERLYSQRGLMAFSDKFSPIQSPRNVSFERYRDLPAALLACTRLEGYAPWPLRRSAPDLTTR